MPNKPRPAREIHGENHQALPGFRGRSARRRRRLPSRSETDLQVKWELHLATAVGGLYIATHRGVQLGVGLASDAVRHQGGGHG